mgnify:CR=1 FL=1|tara:strand:- start:575 stop:769 length:195 start_codon:yes stop_codon:yes gene_type:complete
MKATKKHIGMRLSKYIKSLDKRYHYLITDVTIKGKYILTHTDPDYKKKGTSFICGSIDSYKTEK